MHRLKNLRTRDWMDLIQAFSLIAVKAKSRLLLGEKDPDEDPLCSRLRRSTESSSIIPVGGATSHCGIVRPI
jgi:hypothetical protein